MNTLKQPQPTGLLDRVEFHGRVLEQLLQYQDAMRGFFMRQVEELRNDVRGPMPMVEFPRFEQWVEQQQADDPRSRAGREFDSLIERPAPASRYGG